MNLYKCQILDQNGQWQTGILCSNHLQPAHKNTVIQSESYADFKCTMCDIITTLVADKLRQGESLEYKLTPGIGVTLYYDGPDILEDKGYYCQYHGKGLAKVKESPIFRLACEECEEHKRNCPASECVSGHRDSCARYWVMRGQSRTVTYDIAMNCTCDCHKKWDD